jgi:hypothetical protein
MRLLNRKTTVVTQDAGMQFVAGMAGLEVMTR